MKLLLPDGYKGAVTKLSGTDRRKAMVESRQKKIKKIREKKGYILFSLAGIFCAFLWKAERDLAARGNLLWTGEYLLQILLFSLLAGIMAGVVCCSLCTGAWRNLVNFSGKAKEKNRKILPFLSSAPRFGICSFVLILLCYLPCYLAYYPGICAYDTSIQLEQIVKSAYIDHHPIAHTLLLRGAIELGEAVFGSSNTGIALYMAAQMAFLAAAFAYGIAMLFHFNVKRKWIFAVWLYAMIYPFHWYMSITTTKDTLFSAFFLLQAVSLCGLLRGESERKNRVCHAAVFLAATIGMILFRNNGKYAMLVLLFFLVCALVFGKKERRTWGKITGCALLGFLAGNLVLSALFQATGAVSGDKREMLSVPIQQLARCMIYHGGVGVVPEDDNTLTAEEKNIINEFILYEAYKNYRPEISDPVKGSTNTYVVRYRAKEFLSTYLSLLIRYPGDYINAVLALDAGYFSPGDVSHASINTSDSIEGLGYIQTVWAEEKMEAVGVYKDSKWDSLHEKLEKWANENGCLKLPVLKYLFVPGTYLWLYLLAALTLTVRKKYRYLLPFSLVLGYYVTLVLGPAVQLRYIYPLMIVLPFLVLLLLTGKEEKP